MEIEQGSKQADGNDEQLDLTWLLRVSKTQNTIGTANERTGLCHVSANRTLI
jgi:hypothetical protein